MKHLFSTCLLFFLLASCYQNRSPEVDIPKEEPPISIEMMSDILVDMHLVQSAIKELQVQRKAVEQQTTEYHAQIFKKYGVTREDFDISIEYYNYRIEELNLIYEKVITKLSLMDSEIRSRQRDSVPENDSIRVDTLIL